MVDNLRHPTPSDNALGEMLLSKHIRSILAEKSGGCKFVELVAKITAVYIKNKEKVPLPDTILSVAKFMGDVNYVKYAWHMGDGMYREKFFVYTILPRKEEDYDG